MPLADDQQMPQRKGLVPEELAARITAAQAGLEAAKEERDEAIAAALRAGGSLRQVSAIAGMSQSQVQIIGHARGWPTPAMKKAREQQAEDRARWDALIAIGRTEPTSEPD